MRIIFTHYKLPEPTDDDQLNAKTAKLVNAYEKDLPEELPTKSNHKIVFGSERRRIRHLNSIYDKKLQVIFQTWQRSPTGQERLNNLAILLIENHLARKNDFADVIEKFASAKVRKISQK